MWLEDGGHKPAYIHEREEAERKRKEAENDADRQKIIVALQGIDRKINTANERETTHESNSEILERKRFRLSVGTVVGVWLAAFLTGVQALIFYHTMIEARTASDLQHQDTGAALGKADTANELAKDAQIANFRAWVGPTDAKLEGSPTKWVPLKYIVSYQNSGREPAQGFQPDLDQFTATDADELAGAYNFRMGNYMQKCLATPVIIGARVIYPTSGFSSYQYQGTLSGNLITEPLIAGNRTIIIQGCFAYRTADKDRHSAFCYFFRAGKSDPQHLSICEKGSYAD